MFRALFNIMINLIATIIQIIVWPINSVINATLPDLSDKITQVSGVFGTVFNYISWALSLIPPSVIAVLSFMLVCEIAKHTIFRSTHALVKVWNVFQKIKFW